MIWQWLHRMFPMFFPGLPAAVFCRIKDARGCWITAHAGLTNAWPWRYADGSILRKVTSRGTSSRPSEVRALYGRKYGRTSGRSLHDHRSLATAPGGPYRRSSLHTFACLPVVLADGSSL